MQIFWLPKLQSWTEMFEEMWSFPSPKVVLTASPQKKATLLLQKKTQNLVYVNLTQSAKLTYAQVCLDVFFNVSNSIS